MTKGAQIAVGACAIALLLGWYAYTNTGDSTYRYYQTLEELRSVQSGLGGAALRVHGYVAMESIERDVASKQVRFVVQNDPPHAGGAIGPTLAVLYRSLETPDLFKDGAEVVVEGRLEGSGAEAVLLADNVMAKCPSKFEAKAAAL
jgi:cytochrome c-type biogenesis protein CcmE